MRPPKDNHFALENIDVVAGLVEPTAYATLDYLVNQWKCWLLLFDNADDISIDQSNSS